MKPGENTLRYFIKVNKSFHEMIGVLCEVEEWAIANRGTKDEFVNCYTYPHGEIPEPLKKMRKILTGQ